MKKTLVRTFIAGLLLAVLALAATRAPQNFNPALEIETSDANGKVALSFLFDAQPSLTACEIIIGNIARTSLKQCPQCRISKLRCESALDKTEQDLLDDTPISPPSGRMRNGIIVFHTDNPALALETCQASELLSSRSANPIKCYPPDAKRTKLPGKSPLTPWSPLLLIASFLFAWFAGWLIIRYEHLHAHFSHDHTEGGPQKYHTQPTPRIGGLTVMAGLLAAGGTMLLANVMPSERQFWLLLLAAAPAFLGGLIEDVTKKVGVMERLLLTMLSGAVAAWVLGAVLQRLEIPGVDLALAWPPLAVLFTAFAVGGIANSINIIDGYNGLVGGFSVIVLAAMAFVAHDVADPLVFNISLALAGSILGFLVWNWPGGNIFFGDGGAYLVGFILAELSILLVLRNPAVSPWFPLLLLIYPVFETFYSIYRRKLQNQLSPGQPDNQHLHQLIHDKLIVHSDNGRATSRNSRVAKYLWAPAALLAIIAVIYASSTPMLIASAIGFCFCYVLTYRRLAAM